LDQIETAWQRTDLRGIRLVVLVTDLGGGPSTAVTTSPSTTPTAWRKKLTVSTT